MDSIRDVFVFVVISVLCCLAKGKFDLFLFCGLSILNVYTLICFYSVAYQF